MTFIVRCAALAAVMLGVTIPPGIAGDAADAAVIDGPLVAIPKGEVPQTPQQATARALLKACAAKWKDLKATGQTDGQTWNGFAKKCRNDHADARQAP